MPEIGPESEQSSLSQPDARITERRAARQRRIETILKLAGLPSGGVGIAVTINFLRNGQWIEASVSGLVSIAVIFLAIGGKFAKDVINLVFDKVETRLEQKTDTLADLIVNWLENFAIQFWWQLTAKFQVKYYKTLVYLYRTYQTQGLKTPGNFILDLENVYIQLRFLPQSLDKVSSAIISQQETTSNLKNIWDFLAQITTQSAYKRIAILGAPGSGKTTLLKHIALTYAQNKQSRQHRKAPKLIPVLLILHTLSKEIIHQESSSLAQIITEQLKSPTLPLKLNPQLQWFEEQLKEGKCLIMFDGLDEIAKESDRQQVSQWIDKQMQVYPETTFIITSRRHGYQAEWLQQIRTFLEVQSFNLKQVERFFQNWYLQNEILRQVRKEDAGLRAEAQRKANDLMERIKKSAPLVAMALNPLLLTMIATVHDNRGALPGNRVELYAEICEVLLTRRIEAKGMTDSIKLNLTQKKAVLQVLALELMKRGIREFSLAQGQEIIKSSLAAVAKTEVKPEDFFENIEKISGLLTKKDDSFYIFAHLSFQEYLASVQIQELNQEDLLIQNINHNWWAETIRLYAAKNDISNLILAAINNPNITSISLAMDCLEEGKSCSPEVRQRFNQLWIQGWENR